MTQPTRVSPVDRVGRARGTKASAIVRELRSMADPAAREGQARFGIETRRALGISIPALRAIAKREGPSHELALALWRSGIHEARILATMVDVPAAVTEGQMEAWAADFDSWDLVDQCCSNLLDRTPFAYRKAGEWAARDEEFVKRAGFSLMAVLAAHDKKAPDERFRAFLGLIEREAGDPRNFVKKAVNWALRGIGKRSMALHPFAVETAERILATGAGSARWVASNALRELRKEAVVARIAR